MRDLLLNPFIPEIENNQKKLRLINEEVGNVKNVLWKLEQYSMLKDIRLEKPFKKDQSVNCKSQFVTLNVLVACLVWMKAAGSTLSGLVFLIGQFNEMLEIV